MLAAARAGAADSIALRLDYAQAHMAGASAGSSQPPAPPDTPLAPVREEDTQPRLSDVRWELAPIRWRGQLASDLRLFSAHGQPNRFQQVQSAALQGASYVYQPWFAQLAFGLTGLTSKDHGDQTSRSTALGGNALLSVFPSSRYPFQASFDRSDSRSSDQFTGQQYTTQRMGVRQSYRNPAGDQNTSASFDRSTLTSSSFGRDTVDVWNAAHSRRFGEHSVEGNVNRVLNSRGASGDRSQFDRVFARHNFSDEGLLVVETLGSYGAATQNVGSTGTSARLRNDATQLNSFATWRRSDDDPLYVTGGARFFQSRFSDEASNTESRSVMANAAATYRIARNFTVNGGGSVAQNSSASGSSVLTSQFAGAAYAPDPRRWGEYLYTSNLGANATNQTGGESGGRYLLSVQGSHGVQRSFELSPAQSLWLNAAQTLGVSQDSGAGGQRTLTHYGAASYRIAAENNLSGFASASASDSRTSGYASSSFQLFNLQLSGQGSFGRNSSLTANYTVQGTRQGGGERFVVSANGGITYQHSRAFDVPQLRYLATYQRNDFQLNLRQEGELNAPRDQVNSSFEQRLDYRIGRIEARLSYRLVEVDGKKNALLFLQLVRQFGN